MTATRFDPARLVRLSQGHERLMAALCRRISDGMLDEIAACDYGTDQAAHLAALKRIRSRDIPPGRMAWVPKEVLELFRWSEYGDDRSNRRPRPEAEFHLMRAFCCAALLEAYAVAENHGDFGGSNSTVVQLLESVEVVGGETEAHAPSFLAWMLTRLPSQEDERAFYVLALVWALVRDGAASDTPELAADLIDWAIAEEAVVWEFWKGGIGRHSERWLIGITHFDLRWEKWVQIGRRLGEQAAAVTDAGLRAKLDDLSRRLTADRAQE